MCYFLTPPKDLLKRKELVFGYLVREIHPEKQLAEGVHLFGIKEVETLKQMHALQWAPATSRKRADP